MWAHDLTDAVCLRGFKSGHEPRTKGSQSPNLAADAGQSGTVMHVQGMCIPLQYLDPHTLVEALYGHLRHVLRCDSAQATPVCENPIATQTRFQLWQGIVQAKPSNSFPM